MLKNRNRKLRGSLFRNATHREPGTKETDRESDNVSPNNFTAI